MIHRTVNPRRTALLVLDYQPGVLQSLGPLVDTSALLDRVSSAIGAARDAGASIGFVRSAFADEDFAAIPTSNKVFAPIAEARALREEDPVSALHERLTPRADDILIRKTRLGAFSTSDLDDQLHDRDIQTLLLAGIHTKGVLLSTVIEAVDRDYETYVVTDASADPDPDLHQVLTDQVFSFQAHVVTVAELPSLMRV